MPKKLANLAIMTLTDSKCSVKVQQHLTNYFKVKRELMISLLDTFLDKALRNAEINPNRTILIEQYNI
jgi:hypothetical protein